jgi:queuine tRNA-ribosyltransferase
MYINISNAEFKEDVLPIDPACKCFTCQNHSRAYLYHLFKAQEMLAFRLASIHNLYFFLELMRDIRQAIKEDRFNELKKSILG